MYIYTASGMYVQCAMHHRTLQLQLHHCEQAVSQTRWLFLHCCWMDGWMDGWRGR